MTLSTVFVSLAALSAPALALLSPGAGSEDTWPGWRGPNGSGVGTGSPPIEWSEESNVRWKTPIPGKSNSSPAIWGELVFVTTAVSIGEAPEPAEGEPKPGERGYRDPLVEQDFLLLALQRSNGELAWERSVARQTPHQGTHPDGTFASATPATDGEVVIASFGSYGIYAFDMAGEPLWKVDLGDMDVRRSFGEGSSPVLVGDTVVLVWDHSGDSFIVALERLTGKELWRTSRPSVTTWATPIVIEAKSGPVIVAGGGRAVGYDLATGEALWTLGEPPAPRGGEGNASGVIASPVKFEDLVLYSTGGRGGTLRALRPTTPEGDSRTGELEPDAVLWQDTSDVPGIPSPIAYDGILYVLKSSSGILSAFDALSGERLYGPERLSGLANAYASPVAAGGHIYLSDREGTFEVVKAGPAFESLAINELDDAFDASPAIAGDELYLRGSASLYCIAK
jgi:outer membrane protein assembly factor BamB